MTFGEKGAQGARVHELEDVNAILDVFQKHGHIEVRTFFVPFFAFSSPISPLCILGLFKARANNNLHRWTQLGPILLELLRNSSERLLSSLPEHSCHSTSVYLDWLAETRSDCRDETLPRGPYQAYSGSKYLILLPWIRNRTHIAPLHV
jgi:hypothetical protein